MPLTHNDVLDAALQYIIDNTTKVTVCDSASVATYANATTAKASSGNMLAQIASVSSASYSSLADNDLGGGGRMLTFLAKSSIAVASTGTINALAFVDDSTSKLLHVKPVTAQAVSASSTINIPAHKIAFKDPTAV